MRPRVMTLVHLQTTPRLSSPEPTGSTVTANPPLLPGYPGLAAAYTQQMHEAVRAREHLRYNRLKKALEADFAPIYRNAGVEEIWVRPLAAASALMEARAVATLRQRDHFLEEERRRRTGHRYTLQPAHEQETTKMTWWTLERVPPSGLPLREIETLLDQAVALARGGAFTPRGSLKAVPGTPMVVPERFRRRGWQTHWLDPRYPLLDVGDDLMVVRLV